jgi:hypothetical protein
MARVHSSFALSIDRAADASASLFHDGAAAMINGAAASRNLLRFTRTSTLISAW